MIHSSTEPAPPPVHLGDCCRVSNYADWVLFLSVRKVIVPQDQLWQLALGWLVPWPVPWPERLSRRSMALVMMLPRGSDRLVQLRWGCPIPGSAQAVTKTDGFLANVRFVVGNGPLLQVLKDLPRSATLPYVLCSPSFFSPPEKEEDSHSYQNVIIEVSHSSDLGRCVAVVVHACCTKVSGSAERDGDLLSRRKNPSFTGLALLTSSVPAELGYRGCCMHRADLEHFPFLQENAHGDTFPAESSPPSWSL